MSERAGGHYADKGLETTHCLVLLATMVEEPPIEPHVPIRLKLAGLHSVERMRAHRTASSLSWLSTAIVTWSMSPEEPFLGLYSVPNICESRSVKSAINFGTIAEGVMVR